MERSIKIAVTGKGGVGKTTVSALLSRAFADKGYTVIAVDADPDANLAAAIGVQDDSAITPLVDMEELIEERTGAKPGNVGAYFKMNPKVDDIPEKLWHEQDGIRLLRMGTVKKGGGGCICPESAMLKSVIQNLILFRKECVILDMEAGIEHLGRATASAVDQLIVVTEPGRRSIDTALKIKSLADDINLKNISVIGNKVRNDVDREFIETSVKDFGFLGTLAFNTDILVADQQARPVWELSPESLEIVKGWIETL